jgi:single-stranded-DNA-specific exonuclease
MSLFLMREEVEEEVEKELAVGNKYLAQLLFNRGIKTNVEAKLFLNPSYDQHLHDPFLLHDMEKAVERILQAIKTNETIVILVIMIVMEFRGR